MIETTKFSLTEKGFFHILSYKYLRGLTSKTTICLLPVNLPKRMRSDNLMY